MITSGFLLNRAAYISAVQPRSLSLALTSSPWSIAACICCGVPVSTSSMKVRRLDICRRQDKENQKWAYPENHDTRLSSIFKG